MQIGEPAVIAERTGITTVADFRVRDMAAGGQGAPLVPYADWALFTDRTRPRIVQNIGGIGNLTFLPPRAELDDVIAFDTGPGNMVMDAVVAALTRGRQTFDRDGRWAARGQVSEKLLAEMMAHPFLRRRPPKTTGREEFGEMFVGRDAGVGAAAALCDRGHGCHGDCLHGGEYCRRLSALRVPEAQTHPSAADCKSSWAAAAQRIPTLRRMLAQRIGVGELLTHEDFGIANAAKEALAFAILAHETLLGSRAMSRPRLARAGRWCWARLCRADASLTQTCLTSPQSRSQSDSYGYAKH